VVAVRAVQLPAVLPLISAELTFLLAVRAEEQDVVGLIVGIDFDPAGRAGVLQHRIFRQDATPITQLRSAV
jgi:hypothetical protein